MDENIKLLAIKTAERVARKVKKSQVSDFFRFGNNVGLGADGTATKFIDRLAENTALDLINKSKVKVNVLSEEAGFIDNGGKYTFVLDPLDGTRNAYRGIPFYSVSIGVGKKCINDIEYGIVKNIPTGDVYTAEKGFGAFLNGKRFCVPEIPEYNCTSDDDCEDGEFCDIPAGEPGGNCEPVEGCGLIGNHTII